MFKVPPAGYLEIGLLVLLFFWVIKETTIKGLFMIGWTAFFWHLAGVVPAYGSIVLALYLAGVVGVIWTGKTANLFTDIIFKLFDDYEDYNYKHEQLGIQTLSAYAHKGKHRKVIRLAERLKRDGTYNPLVLEAFIARAKPKPEKLYEPTLYKLKREYLEPENKARDK
ncbi:hypothetical protein NXS98_10720 [Fontisphaera persica]|uniref:hypothetical protein n=1 Tax=Fontisphaera persica TaxID=2974023 RepID=UPI0024C0CBBB|nr:hypothetical protein [Fontisphaera persica]WCJ58197.1 hypothetical protein NXS98_10720 [Fontisphaera persica]